MKTIQDLVRLVRMILVFCMGLAYFLGSNLSCDAVKFSNHPYLDTFNYFFNVEAVDVLFVMDDSVSMNSLLSSIVNGFKSLSESDFPSNTKMAVTYMSPAKYFSGQPDYQTPLNIWAEKTPGFMQLVSRKSIETFLSYDNANFPEGSSDRQAFLEGKNNFKIAGCDDEWFSPDQRNHPSDGKNSNSCLEAAIQAPYFATQVEAGTVSLANLVSHFSSNLKRPLFREGSSVNVIFVSDTHDPGVGTLSSTPPCQGYYGGPNAPETMSDYTSLKVIISSSNPGVEYLKFSAITRMPPANDPLLEGVNTVGMLPEDYTGTHVNTEPDCFFSYLPFVRESGGLAMHVGNTNWNELVKSLVKDFSTRRAAEFRLSKRAKFIEIVTVDEKALSSDEFYLSEDGMRLVLKINFDPKVYHSVSARYRSEE
ncbi:MAG: hypothetical protein IPJ71_04790 [Bdellovibrionales bacterium]|nr:hypothetical protein [Bdellovibrionales bacterium]